MKIYKVKVNGKVYEVELEAVSEVKGSIETAPKAQENIVSNGAGEEVLAPIGGNVLNILVKVGDKVELGSPIAIIEAMKLENEIVSTKAGVVKQVLVSKGQSVQQQQALIVVG